MCLSNVSERMTTPQDIVAYKVMILKGTELISSYRQFGYVLGERYHSKLDNSFIGYIDEGIHTFVRIEDAEREAKHWNRTSNEYKEIVVECTIPAGSEYYVGEYYSDLGCVASMASDQIIIVKK